MSQPKPALPEGYPDQLPPAALREWTLATYRQAFALKVTEEQAEFVASNVGSLAQAYFHEEARPLGLFAGELAVGFVMLSVEDVPQGVLWIWRLMIGTEHQRKGFGRQAIAAVLAYARGVEGVKEIKLSHVDEVPGNPGPFYRSLGFVYTGELDEGERVMRRDLSPLPE